MAGLLDFLFGGQGSGLLGYGGPAYPNGGASVQPQQPDNQGMAAMAQAAPQPAQAQQVPDLGGGFLNTPIGGMLAGMNPAAANAIYQRQMMQTALKSLMTPTEQGGAGMSLPKAMITLQNPKVQEQLFGIQSVGSYKTPGGYEAPVINNAGRVAPVFPTANGQPPADLSARTVKPGESVEDFSGQFQQGGSQPQGGRVLGQNTNGLLDDKTAEYNAYRFWAGDKNAAVASRGSGELGQINNIKQQQAIMAVGKLLGKTPEDIATAQGGFENTVKSNEAFGTGKQGDAVRSFSVALDHADLFKSLAKAMNNGDVRAINEIKNVWNKEFKGSPLPTNLDAAKQILSAEIAKAVQGADVAQGDREHLQDALKSANSWQQLSGVIDSVYTPLMAGQIKGLRRQYLANTKQPSGEFDKLLSPRAYELTHGFPTVAADALRKNPSLRDQFDQKYGEGSAADILGK